MARHMGNTSHTSSVSVSPFLHVVLRRSDYETWAHVKQIQRTNIVKGPRQSDFDRYSLQKSNTNSDTTAFNVKNRTSPLVCQQLSEGKQAISNRSTDGLTKDQRSRILPFTPSIQLHPEKVTRSTQKQYVFDQVSQSTSQWIECHRFRRTHRSTRVVYV
jgi:hypothetical protein